ncbi:hypothetical protein [Cellvibrio mixtus]|uniref:hypothetical protein n=1 Tax=Cellvibrio mixtus TaxID=39650 RepID=UPI0012699A4C|nr:hypothetical protein [Cellvibrio mixtus]
MKLFKFISALTVSCIAFVSFPSFANTPASCSWEITSTSSTAQQQTTNQRCKDNNSNAWFATRTLVSSAPFTSPPTCTINVIGNTINTGTCLQPNLVRTSTACQSGIVLGQSCKYTNGILNPGPNDMGRYTVCGDASCPLSTTEKGYNTQCKPASQSQQYNNPIIEWACQ